MNSKDIPEEGLPLNLDWSVEMQEETLHRIKAYAIDTYIHCMDWYRREKVGKRYWGKAIRLLVVVLTGLAGLIPILSDLLPKQIGEFFPNLFPTGQVPILSASWATVALALVASLIALDRFFGFTSGWIRYELAAQELARSRHRFDFDWEQIMFTRSQEPASPEHARRSLALCCEFLREVNEIKAKETDAWAKDFSQQISDSDKSFLPSDYKR